MSSFTTTEAFEDLTLKLAAMDTKKVLVNRKSLTTTLEYIEFYTKLKRPLAGERDTLREGAYLLGETAEEPA